MEKLLSSFILFGCKGVGKSTQGRYLAKQFDTDFYDIDALIEEQSGLPPAALYRKQGVNGFMSAEEQACILAASKIEQGKKVIISTGGGICDNPPALNALRGLGQFVFLRADVDFLINKIMCRVKVSEDGKLEKLPSYIAVKNPKDINQARSLLYKLFSARTKLYESICDVTIDIKKASRAANTANLIEALQNNII